MPGHLRAYAAAFERPWMTPFLKTVHLISELPILRKMWGKLDALATMTEREHDTYYNWHAHQADVDRALTETFTTELREVRYGKLYFVGVKS